MGDEWMSANEAYGCAVAAVGPQQASSAIFELVAVGMIEARTESVLVDEGDLPRRHEEAHWTALCIRHSVRLGKLCDNWGVMEAEFNEDRAQLIRRNPRASHFVTTDDHKAPRSPIQS